MKSLSIISFCFIVYNILTIICATENVNTSDQPSFSFDKDTFDNFEFNLTDEMLNHDSFIKKPFCRFTPIWNFVYSFCLLFQHSLIKHDDEFLEIFKKFFECCHEKNYESEPVECKHENFEDLLVEHEKKIQKIFNEKDKRLQPFLIEEKNGKIHCVINESFNLENNKLNSSSNITVGDNTSSAMMYFFMRYNEMYLENLLGTKYTETFDQLTEKYIADDFNQSTSEYDREYNELWDVFLQVMSLVKAEIIFSSNMSQEDYRKICTKHLKLIFDGYIVLMKERSPGFKLPGYLEYLMMISNTKILLNISDNLNLYPYFHKEYPNTLLALKNHLRKYFDKYNLSEKSIEILIFLCFEMDV